MDIAQQAAMMSPMRQTNIEGKTYSIMLLSAIKGMTIGQKLIEAFSPAAGIVFDKSQEEDSLFNENTTFRDIAVAITARLDRLDMPNTVRDLFQGLACNGQQVNFDEHFRGNLGEMLLVLEFALKENFGDFFTKYLKAKGLEIHTLREMMAPLKEENLEESENK